MPSDLDKLSGIVSNFVKESSIATAELKTNYIHLTNAVTESVNVAKEAIEISRKAIETNIRLEAKISSLENKAIDKLNLVEDTVNEIAERVTINSSRIQVLELINANNQGKEEANKANDQKWYTKWSTMIGLFGLLVAAGSLIYTMVSTGIKP